MVIEITTSSPKDDHRNLTFNSGGFYVVLYNYQTPGKSSHASNSFQHFTQTPIISNENGSLVESHNSIDVKTLHAIQNEVSGIVINKDGEKLSALLFSTKLSRSRVYFLQREDSVFLSFDMRELLPFSQRLLNKEIVYGIIKFGETPEYYSLIDDIFVVPVGCYLELDNHVLKGIISKRKKISLNDFTPYHRINYSLTGGNINETKNELKNILSFLHCYKPALLISGGIDSTLLNFLYNEISEDSYPAFFFDFKEASVEREFANWSIKNTKAELIPVLISNTNLIDNFKQSVEKLIYPVYDNGSALVGQMFSNTLHANFGRQLSLIDGTLADSCYGVRDYSKPLLEGKYQPEVYSLFKEWIYAKTETYGVVINKWTHPRDSYLNDEFLQDLLWYSGVYSNIWFYKAKHYTTSLKKKYYWYMNIIEESNREQYWPRYTVLKMLLYAAKQTSVKVYDMLSPTQVHFPFMFKSILLDQGKYEWHQKSSHQIVKAPLKKILEQYISADFIYRRKVGLQSQTRLWINEKDFKKYILDLLTQKNSITREMMGNNVSSLISEYRKNDPTPSILSLVLSLAVIQQWINLHRIKCS